MAGGEASREAPYERTVFYEDTDDRGFWQYDVNTGRNQTQFSYVDDENDYLITELKKSQDILEFIESEIAKIMGLKVSIQVKAAKGLSENSSTENNVQENISEVFDIENID